MARVTILGKVVQGKHMGRALGFPTANVKPLPGQRVPESGVYVGAILIEGEAAERRCLINHGLQPTLPSGKTTVEVYILDFERDIYAKRVRLGFDAFIRPEREFASVELLKAQLEKDAAFARNWVNNWSP